MCADSSFISLSSVSLALCTLFKTLNHSLKNKLHYRVLCMSQNTRAEIFKETSKQIVLCITMKSVHSWISSQNLIMMNKRIKRFGLLYGITQSLMDLIHSHNRDQLVAVLSQSNGFVVATTNSNSQGGQSWRK